MPKQLYTLFIRYSSNHHYAGVYTSIEEVHSTLEEFKEDVGLRDAIPTIQTIERQLDNKGAFYHQFSDESWIFIQTVSPYLVTKIMQDS